MKKTISTNIGGIIFHIEEDGYEKLHQYLQSINSYFSSFEESGEIITDIESRIAEIFLTKLENGRQVVNIQDVTELIATMGTTKDFEAIEPDNDPYIPETDTEAEVPTGQSPLTEPTPRRLYRDVKRKVISGVASGIGHYLSIDPLWIRLLFLLLFINTGTSELSGIALITYIVLWIALPPNDQLEDDRKVKKLYRNPGERVLGGVSSGLAVYFAIDIALVRILFVLSIFLGGAGVIMYIILWIITPEAKTLTEKMQMQGEPVTLSNIAHNLKQSIKVENGEESPIVKILLFPFRLIALLIGAIGSFLGPALKALVELLRLAFGALLAVIGFALMLSLIAAVLGILGFGGWEHLIHLEAFPLDLIRRTLEPITVVSALFILFIPALALTLLGLTVIAKRSLIKGYFGWTLLGTWVLALLFGAYFIPKFAHRFAIQADIEREEVFLVKDTTPTLRVNDIGKELGAVKLTLKAHADSNYLLILNIGARGESRKAATSNAEDIIYHVSAEGNDLVFDSDITLGPEDTFQFQGVYATLYIPYGKEFVMDASLEKLLFATLHPNGYKLRHVRGNHTWLFANNGLLCMSCEKETTSHRNEERVTYPFEDFTDVKVSAQIELHIHKGTDYKVEALGSSEYLDMLQVRQVGNELSIELSDEGEDWWNSNGGHDELTIHLRMPVLEYLELNGVIKANISGFTNDRLQLSTFGASKTSLDVDVSDLGLDMKGASELKLAGSAERFTAELAGASEVKAFDLRAKDVEVKALGASNIKVFASRSIEIEAYGASKVRYRGTDNVTQSIGGLSSIEKD